MTGASPYSDNALTAHDLKRIGLALGGQPDGKGWRARCPVHDDHDPSLSLRSGDNVPLLVKCWAGCDPRDILAELRRRGLLGDQRGDWKPRPIRPNPRAVEPDRAKLRYLLGLLRPIEGTLIDAYLDSRGWSGHPGHHLRFLPARPLSTSGRPWSASSPTSLARHVLSCTSRVLNRRLGARHCYQAQTRSYSGYEEGRRHSMPRSGRDSSLGLGEASRPR